MEDKLRLQKFLDTMPTNMANRLTGRMLYRRFTPELLTKLENFKENFIRNFYSDFSNPEIKKAQEKFYQSLKELDWFILMNFKRSTTTGDYHLRTTIQRGGGKWNELVAITNEFSNDYKKLVSVANEKLSSNESKNSTTQQPHNVAKTEYQNYILYFCGKEIDFTRKDNQRELLKTLFKDKNKEWFYDEIQGEWDSDWDGAGPESRDYWRKFYNASNDINTAIRLETGIKDFLMKNTGTGGWIKINPKYV